MRFLIITLLLTLLTGCAQNPVTGKADFVMMSENQELAICRQADEQVKKQYPVYPSKTLQDYVNNVGQKIAEKSHRPDLPYHFTVLDSTEINAFAKLAQRSVPGKSAESYLRLINAHYPVGEPQAGEPIKIVG